MHAGHKVGLVGANGSRQVEPLRADPRRAPPRRRQRSSCRPRGRSRTSRRRRPPSRRRRSTTCWTATASCATIERALAAAEAAPTPIRSRRRSARRAASSLRRDRRLRGARARRDAARRASASPSAQHGDPVASFSGGWRMRLNLAQALMCRSDLLLLDEPTNHLDLDAVLWLEDWLARYPGTLLLITHDRDFLDGVVDTIVHVDGRKLTAYTRQLLAVRARARASSSRCSRRPTRSSSGRSRTCRSFIDRFRAKATKAKQAQSRIKALERMELIAAAHVDSPFEFTFPPVGTTARAARAARARDARLRRARRRCSRDLDWGILAGDAHRPARPERRRQVDAAEGDRRHARAAARGDAAHRAAACDSAISRSIRSSSCAPSESPLWHLRGSSPTTREQELRDFLGGFDFRGDMATPPVGRLLRRREGAAHARADRAPAARTCCCSTSRPIISTSRCARR